MSDTLEISLEKFVAMQKEAFNGGGLYALVLLDTKWVWYRSRRWNIRRMRTVILSTKEPEESRG